MSKDLLSYVFCLWHTVAIQEVNEKPQIKSYVRTIKGTSPVLNLS